MEMEPLIKTSFSKTIEVNQFEAEMFIASLNSDIEVEKIVGDSSTVRSLELLKRQALRVFGMEGGELK